MECDKRYFNRRDELLQFGRDTGHKLTANSAPSLGWVGEAVACAFCSQANRQGVTFQLFAECGEIIAEKNRSGNVAPLPDITRAKADLFGSWHCKSRS